MTHYKKLTFHHANLNRPLDIVAGTIAGWHWSEPTKSMVIYTTAGIFPVAESREQITELIESINRPNGQETVNAETTVRRPAVNIRKRKTRKER